MAEVIDDRNDLKEQLEIAYIGLGDWLYYCNWMNWKLL
jgi:hypothetical protein